MFQMFRFESILASSTYLPGSWYLAFQAGISNFSEKARKIGVKAFRLSLHQFSITCRQIAGAYIG